MMKPLVIRPILCLIVGSGCYTADFDPTAVGVFACDLDPDEAPCPSGRVCVNQRCEDEEALPSVSVLNPEEEQALVREVIDVIDGLPEREPLDLKVTLQGTLTLVAPGSAHVFGEGHLVVQVDEQEVAVLDSGDISGATAVNVRVSPTAGAHRITVQARRNDGIDYDHPEARAQRLFWLEPPPNEGRRPFVAIKSPWPGEVFSTETTEINVEIATRNFMMAPSQIPVRQENIGHAHLHYDDDLPACTREPDCDGGYLGIILGPGTGRVTLPTSSEQSINLSAVLRHNDHHPYWFPFECEPQVGPLECRAIIDEIDILRVAP